MTVFLYGPKACGKTHNKTAIAKMLGIKQIKDDWIAGDQIHPGALHITYESRETIIKKTKKIPDVRLISYESAMNQLSEGATK